MRLHALVILASAAAAFVVTADSADGSEFSTKETRAMMHAYAKCVVKRQGKKASEALLANSDNDTILRKYKMLIVGDCLASKAPVTTQMSFSGDLYRYALADALVSKELAGTPVPDLSAVPALQQRSAEEPPQEVGVNGKKLSKKKYAEALESYKLSVGYAFLARYGECIVRLDTSGAKSLLLTTPDSPEESARFDLLKPALGNCLKEGQTLSFGKVALRGSIAINYYRLVHAASPAVLQAGG